MGRVAIVSSYADRLTTDTGEQLRRVRSLHPARSPGGLVAAIEHIGDLIDALRTRSGVTSGGAQIDVTEAGRNLVDADPGLEAVRGPVGPQRVWVREPLRYASDTAGAADKPVHSLGRESDRILVGVTTQPHEQRMLITQPNPTGERMNLDPRVDRLLHCLGHRDLTLAPTLTAHEQPEVSSVRARSAQILGTQTTQLGRAQPTVAQHPQQRIVALASKRPAISNPEQICVVGIRQGLRRPGLVAGSAHVGDRVITAKLASQRPDHRHIDPGSRWRCRSSAASSTFREIPPVGGDHIGVQITNHRRAPQLLAQPISERPVDRGVLPTRPRRGSSSGDPFGLAEEVALRKRALGGRVDGARDLSRPLPHLRNPVEDLELLPGHGRRLSRKSVISGHVKPGIGWLIGLVPLLGSALVRSVKRSFRT